MRNYHQLRNAVTLGTGLTALFLLVRCSVPGRDYSPLGIDENVGSGAGSGSGGDGSGGASAGQGGLGGLPDAGGQGGQAGEPPVEPIPCVSVSNDAGTTDAGTSGSSDAGTTDAGTTDAGTTDNPCVCVDGFIRAVDADGDGDGTRACGVAPGLDCDDDNAAVTHNSCGGCAVLPNTIGEDCLDCGTYTCDGPDAVICGSKPGPVEDPDCRCLNGLIVARDTDRDGEGTRLCEYNPGNDCNDGNAAFVSNVCGGCESLAGTPGQACNQCGVYDCVGTALTCVPSPSAGGHCANSTTRQTCQGNGYWGNDFTCPNVCYQNNCEICARGDFRCVDLGGGSTQVQQCDSYVGASSSSSTLRWRSYRSCVPGQTCNENNGTCTTGYLFLPRDRAFDVVPLLQRGGQRWHDVLNTASDSDYG